MVSANEDSSIGQKNDFVVIPHSGLSFIEQLQISCSKPCTKTNTPYLIGVNQNEHKALLTKAACKCWDCETCAARSTRVWIACVINGCNKLDTEWSFLTLTAHKSKRGKNSVDSLRQGWKKFYNRILAQLEKSAKNLFYVRVWEQHKDGSFHLHILISVCFGTRWAKDNAAECGLGYMAEWHKVDNAGMVAGYIAKYSLKNSTIARGGVAWPKGLRRVEKSRNWPKLGKKEANLEWSWNLAGNREFQLHQADRLLVSGYEIIDVTQE